MTAIVLVLLILMVLLGVGVAYGVHHRRSRAGGVIGIHRSSGSKGKSG